MGFRHAVITGGSALEARLAQVRVQPGLPKAKSIGKPSPKPKPKKAAKTPARPLAGKRKKQTPAARAASLRNLAKAREARGA